MDTTQQSHTIVPVAWQGIPSLNLTDEVAAELHETLLALQESPSTRSITVTVHPNPLLDGAASIAFEHVVLTVLGNSYSRSDVIVIRSDASTLLR